jgi:hypothetical protein
MFLRFKIDLRLTHMRSAREGVVKKKNPAGIRHPLSRIRHFRKTASKTYCQLYKENLTAVR